MILVSACLLGLCARYDGGHNACAPLIARAGLGRFLPVCPEQLGGLPTPRPAAEIAGGDGWDVLAGRARVVDSRGGDITAPFVRGAEQLVVLAGLVPVSGAILKARSPSCGVGRIYDGTFARVTRGGSGVAAALLARRGIPLCTEEEVTEESLTRMLAADAQADGNRRCLDGGIGPAGENQDNKTGRG